MSFVFLRKNVILPGGGEVIKRHGQTRASPRCGQFKYRIAISPVKRSRIIYKSAAEYYRCYSKLMKRKQQLIL